MELDRFNHWVWKTDADWCELWFLGQESPQTDIFILKYLGFYNKFRTCEDVSLTPLVTYFPATLFENLRIVFVTKDLDFNGNPVNNEHIINF